MCDKEAFKCAHFQKFICLAPAREAPSILIIPHVKESVTPAAFVLFCSAVCYLPAHSQGYAMKDCKVTERVHAASNAALHDALESATPRH